MEREVGAESRLESVTVYASGALCRRRVVVETGGEPVTRVRVGALPLAADASSLRARALIAGPRVTDVRRELRAEPVPPERLASLHRDVDAAEEAYDAARARRDRLALRVDATASLRAVPPTPRRGDPPRPAPVEAFLALAEFVDTRLAALHPQLLAAEDAVAGAEHALDLARHRLAEASHALPAGTARTTADAVVSLLGVQAGTTALELELEYVVPGATWFPSYQLRLDGSAGGDGGLALRASVAQLTGEDWTGVRLSLSTADLLRRTSLPELRSIRLGRRQDEAAPGPLWREPPTGTAELFGGYDDAARRRTPDVGSEAAGAPLRRVEGPRAAGPRPAAPYGGPPVPVSLGAAPRSPAVAPRRAGGPPMPSAPAAPGGPPPGGPVPLPQAQAAAFGASVPPPLPPTPPVPVPDPALQDYAGLVLAGADAPPAGRGRLAPESVQPCAAHAVGEPALPPHAV
ncbi:DUF4139 domain-containing protein, partial [Streptacidiphilus jiangxiensis]